VEGEVKLNGKVIESIHTMSSVSGYVQQDDLFIGTLKVKEHLLFQAMLRMDKRTPKIERLKRIDQVLADVFIKQQ
jgi:ABC-type multidrug transport system ATPase subunit